MLHWYRPPLTLDTTRGEEKIYEAWNSFVCVCLLGCSFVVATSFETSVVSPRHSAVALYRIIIDAQHIWLGSQQQQRQLSLVPTYLECMYCIYLHFASASTYTSPALRRIIQYLRVLDAPVADARHYRNAYCISLTTHKRLYTAAA
jgi:hypothetical protein